MDKLLRVVLLSLVALSCHPVEVSAKADYQIEVKRIEFDKKYDYTKTLNVHYFHVTKFNRTTPVANVSLEAVLDYPADTTMKVTAYEKMENGRYSMIPVPVFTKKNICLFLSQKVWMYEQIVEHSNFPSKCPVKKGVYVLNNYVLDTDNYPPQLPGKNWRVEFEVAFGREIRYIIIAHFTIVRD